jgi:hypothetical protein
MPGDGRAFGALGTDHALARHYRAQRPAERHGDSGGCFCNCELDGAPEWR